MRRRKKVAIVGGGHNGLIAAAYLTKHCDVTVFESRGVLGGCASTEEIWKGYKVSPAAYVVSLLDPQIIKDLRLKENGFKILRRDPSSFSPDLNGPGILLGHDTSRNQNSINKYNALDAGSFIEYEAMLKRVAVAIEPMLQMTPPVSFGRKVSTFRKMKEMMEMYRLYKHVSSCNISEALEIMTEAATPILNRWFKTELLRATLATDAIIGSFAPPSHPGSAYVLLHHVMGEAGGARGVWGYVQGGMGELSHAIVKSSPDVSINLNTPVQEIITENNKVKGICLDGVKGLPFDIVVSSVDANVTFNKLLARGSLMPQEFSDEVNKIDYSSASARVNLALTELPKFDGYGDEVCRGTIHISPSLEYIERAYFDAAVDGKISEKPILEITIPTAVDDTIAPSGKHIMSIFVQYAPYKLKDREWDSAAKDELFENCMLALEDYILNIRNITEHVDIISPVDLERRYGITGGNIFQGAMSLSKLFMGRPAFGWSDYRTPIKGLYMCGAATHPGGGVMGLAGMNAAREIIRDL